MGDYIPQAPEAGSHEQCAFEATCIYIGEELKAQKYRGSYYLDCCIPLLHSLALFVFSF